RPVLSRGGRHQSRILQIRPVLSRGGPQHAKKLYLWCLPTGKLTIGRRSPSAGGLASFCGVGAAKTNSMSRTPKGVAVEHERRSARFSLGSASRADVVLPAWHGRSPALCRM